MTCQPMGGRCHDPKVAVVSRCIIMIDVFRLLSKLCQAVNKMAAWTDALRHILFAIIFSEDYLYNKNLRESC